MTGKKQKVHIIYVVEDGISSLTCGVGAIAFSFLKSFSDIARSLLKDGIQLKLSVISLEYSHRDIGYNEQMLRFSNSTCRKHYGKLVLIEKDMLNSKDYFNFEPWRILNDKINSILRKLHSVKDDKTIVIANDTIFAHVFLNRLNVINVWLPHSLSFVHKQSYVDYKKRFRWEKDAIDRICASKSDLVGYISDFVKAELRRKLRVSDSKLTPFFNGLNLNLLESYSKREKTLTQYLTSRGIPTNKDIVLSFGRADEYKGLDTALESMIQLGNKYKYYPVLIASKFSDEKIVKDIQKKLKKIACKSKIDLGLFLGYEFDLPKYLLQHKRVKFLINVPVNDFCPLVPYEAEIIGHEDLVVINSNIPCFSSSIKDMSNGFLVSPNINAIASKIKTILNLPDPQRRIIIKKGKGRAKKMMDLEKNYLESIRNLIKMKL